MDDMSHLAQTRLLMAAQVAGATVTLNEVEVTSPHPPARWMSLVLHPGWVAAVLASVIALSISMALPLFYVAWPTVGLLMLWSMWRGWRWEEVLTLRGGSLVREVRRRGRTLERAVCPLYEVIGVDADADGAIVLLTHDGSLVLTGPPSAGERKIFAEWLTTEIDAVRHVLPRQREAPSERNALSELEAIRSASD